MNNINTKKLFLAAIIFLFIFCAGSTRAAENEILPVDELETGMRGYGKTVLDGQKIDTFPVEILGIMENVMPDQDLILVKAEGETLSHTKIISGMSGSPIYINEKLIGALAYSWSFEKEPIAGVTPIEKIRNASKFSAGAGSGEQFKKITTPLVASGFSENSLEFVTDKFEEIGLPVQYISGGNPGEQELDREAINSLEAGSAVGIQLVRGDLNMAAIGTATEINREEGTIYALGHPFLNAGDIEFPLTAARVQTFVPSLQSSFKIASPENPVGIVTEDRQATVSGKLGGRADLLPVEITLETPGDEFQEKYSIEIIRNEFLTPGLLNSVTANFVQAHLQQLGVNKISTSLELKLAENPDLNISRVASTSSVLDHRPFLQLRNLWRNPFQQPDVEKARVHLTLQKGNKSALISNFWTDRSHVTPGEKLTTFVELTPHRKDKQYLKFNFQLPDNLSCKQVRLSALPAARLASRDPKARSLKQMVKNLNTRKNLTKLAVAIEYPGLNMNFDGQQYNNLPPAFARMFAAGNNQKAQPVTSLIEHTEVSEWSLNGQQTIKLPVKSK